VKTRKKGVRPSQRAFFSSRPRADSRSSRLPCCYSLS
jgi:hypothetical protein